VKTTTGTQTFANCSQAPINLRRDLSQINPAVGALIVVLCAVLWWIAGNRERAAVRAATVTAPINPAPEGA